VYRVNKLELMVLLASAGQSVCAGASYHACTHAMAEQSCNHIHIASVSIKVLSSRGTFKVLFAALSLGSRFVLWGSGVTCCWYR
jgi:hypothetical protein